jgi:hypothetical protein
VPFHRCAADLGIFDWIEIRHPAIQYTGGSAISIPPSRISDGISHNSSTSPVIPIGSAAGAAKDMCRLEIGGTGTRASAGRWKGNFPVFRTKGWPIGVRPDSRDEFSETESSPSSSSLWSSSSLQSPNQASSSSSLQEIVNQTLLPCIPLCASMDHS